jgi:hypothetical protein
MPGSLLQELVRARCCRMVSAEDIGVTLGLVPRIQCPASAGPVDGWMVGTCLDKPDHDNDDRRRTQR